MVFGTRSNSADLSLSRHGISSGTSMPMRRSSSSGSSRAQRHIRDIPTHMPVPSRTGLSLHRLAVPMLSIATYRLMLSPSDRATGMSSSAACSRG